MQPTINPIIAKIIEEDFTIVNGSVGLSKTEIIGVAF